MSTYLAQLRSESTKISRTAAFVLAGLGGLVALAIGLHAFGLSASSLANGTQQRGILIDVGSNLCSAFAALLGALVITIEFRTGTIRPTLLASPRRSRVFAAKAGIGLLLGALAGLIATGVAAGVAAAGLGLRGITIGFSTGDVAELIVGGTLGGALWAVIGLAIGSLVRAQVPAIVGLLAWILFVENILTDLPTIHQYAPAALVQALAGGTRGGVLTSATEAALLLIAYTVAAAVAGAISFGREDVA